VLLHPAPPYRRFAECRAFACKYALTHCVLQKQKAMLSAVEGARPFD
jgi:hypothetical protein